MRSTLFVLIFGLALALVGPALLAPSAQAFSLFASKYQSATPHLSPDGGEVRIPVSDVNDGKMHHYRHTVDGTKVDFFLLQSNDGTIRAAFDACDVCYRAKKGYVQDGDMAVCVNCGMRFHESRINVVSGGCNPSPLTRAQADGHVIIKVSDIAAGARYF